MFKRIIIATATSLALVVATGGAALACVTDPPPDDTPLCGVVDEVTHDEFVYQRVTETDWVLTTPGEGWVQIDEKSVTDKDAEDVTVKEAQHYSLLGSSGIGKDDTPVPPTPTDDGYWQPNTHQEPHGSDNVTWVGGGLHYTSAGSSGNRDWFFFAPAVIEHHDAVTHHEFRFRLIETTGWLTEVPAGDGWAVIDTRTVVDVEGDPGYPCDDTETISPNAPVVKDKCGVENDHYGLPQGPDGVTYTRSPDASIGPDITATITADDTVWGLLGEGWVDNGDGTATYPFSATAWDETPCTTVYPLPALFDAGPGDATCDAAGDFDETIFGDNKADFGDGITQYGFENVVVVVNRQTAGQVTLTVYANPGYTLGLRDGWTPVEGYEDTIARRTFDLPEQLSGPEACPTDVGDIEVTPVIHQIDACGTANDGWDFGDDENVGLTYTQDGDLITFTATEGYVIVEGDGYTLNEDGTATFDLNDLTWNDTACPTTTPPVPASNPKPPVTTTTTTVVHHSTPAPAHLASTGSNGTLALAAGALALLGLGSALTVARRRYSRV